MDDLKKLSKAEMVSYLYIRDLIRDSNNIKDTKNLFSYNTIMYIILLIIIIVLVILLICK